MVTTDLSEPCTPRPHIRSFPDQRVQACHALRHSLQSRGLSSGIMPRYALLILPAFNRVYGESSVRLTRNELAVFSARALGNQVLSSDETRIGGVPYVTFETAGPLSEADVALLSDLSSVYAVFGMEGELLRPLAMSPRDRLSSDLITIQ